MSGRWGKIPITPYRLLVPCILLALGINKTVLALNGENVAPNIIDFILGIVIAILYVPGHLMMQ